jgi:hypothetical protein
MARGRMFLSVLTIFWGIGLVMQLLGTAFERYVLSLVLLMGFITHFRLARKKPVN